jgi:hypothetical protein
VMQAVVDGSGLRASARRRSLRTSAPAGAGSNGPRSG